MFKDAVTPDIPAEQEMVDYGDALIARVIRRRVDLFGPPVEAPKTTLRKVQKPAV